MVRTRAGAVNASGSSSRMYLSPFPSRSANSAILTRSWINSSIQTRAFAMAVSNVSRFETVCRRREQGAGVDREPVGVLVMRPEGRRDEVLERGD